MYDLKLAVKINELWALTNEPIDSWYHVNNFILPVFSYEVLYS